MLPSNFIISFLTLQTLIHVRIPQKESLSLLDAAEEGSTKMALVALEFGASVDFQKNGRTAFQIIFTRLCKYDIGEETEPSTDNQSVGERYLGYERMIKLLYEKGADINLIESSTMTNGFAPLHYAAKLGCHDRVKWLLDRNAFVDVRNASGETPLMNACEQGHLKVAILLVHNKADFRLTSNNGMTVLHFAAKDGNMVLLEFLMECGGVHEKSIHCKKGLIAADICQQKGFGMSADYLRKVTMPRQDRKPLIDNLTKKEHGRLIDNPIHFLLEKKDRRSQKRSHKSRIKGSPITTLSHNAQWKYNWSRMK